MQKIKFAFLTILIALCAFKVSARITDNDDVDNVLCFHEHHHFHIHLPILPLLAYYGGSQIYNYMFPSVKETSACINPCSNGTTKINSENQAEIAASEKTDYLKEKKIIQEIDEQKAITELKYLEAKSIHDYIATEENLKEKKKAVNIMTEIYEAAQKAADIASIKIYDIENNQDAKIAANSAQNFARKAKQYLLQSELMLLEMKEVEILEEIQQQDKKVLAFLSYIEAMCEDESQNIDEIEKAVKGAIEAADLAFSKAEKIAFIKEAQTSAASAYRHAQKAKKKCLKN